MITGFEEYTKDLSDYERETLLPTIAGAMKLKVGIDNQVTNTVAVSKLKKAGYKISEARFRKIMHIIRVSGIVPGIIATSNGYYIADQSGQWLDYLSSLRERITHIQSLHDAIEAQYAEWLDEQMRTL